MDIRRILAPTDLSKLSQQGLKLALELAETFGAQLLLLHVIEPPPYPLEGIVPPHVGAGLLDDLQRQARTELAELLPEARTRTVDVARRVMIGNPSRKIVEVAAEEKVGMIVMTTHGRTGLSHLVMGSVTEKVIRTAPCPVLTMRPTVVTA